MAKRCLSIRIALLGLGCLLGLVATELIFGGWFRDNAISRLNLVHDRTVHYDLNGIYDSVTGVAVYRRDRYGLRGFYRSPDSIDILTLGGSATDQRFITEGETWQDRMREEWLSQGRDLTVVNAGVDGQSSLGHLKNFEWWFPHVPKLRPRFILYYIGVNDLFGNVGTHWDAIERPELAEQSLPLEEREQLGLKGSALTINLTASWNGLLSFVGQRVHEESAIAYLWRTAKGALRAQSVKLSHGRGFRRKREHWTSEHRLDDPVSLIRGDLEGYAERVQLLISRARNLGAQPIVVSQAAHYYLEEEGTLLGFNDTGFLFKEREVLGVDIYYMLKAYGDTALQVCRMNPGCIPINLFGELKLTTGDYYDNVHLTPQGALKVARYLVTKLDTTVSPRGKD